MNPLSVGVSARSPDYLSLSFILSFSLSRDSPSSIKVSWETSCDDVSCQGGFVGVEVPDERCDHEPLTWWEVCKRKKNVRCC